MNLLILALYAALAGATEYSVNVGVDHTDAAARAGRVTGRANGRFGLGMEWAPTDSWRIATGTDYVFRRVNWRRADDVLVRVDFDYVDVPVTVRYRAGAGVSAFAGGRVGINVLDKPEVPRPTPSFDPRARAIILLAEVGVRYDFDARWSAELAFEREVAGDFAANLTDYQTYGLRGRYGF